jgi:hypothetical protein
VPHSEPSKASSSEGGACDEVGCSQALLAGHKGQQLDAGSDVEAVLALHAERLQSELGETPAEVKIAVQIG